ncbi:hypothetical protein MKK84_10105, partial [Methylobacterium sp. E-065]|uniref:hypothetical protein n=1 Tax=Methylobacterium sp. E-065 TaxID=2836583 RepID=UPI001FBBCBB6
MSEGCYARLAELRSATISGPMDFDPRRPLRLEPGQVVVHQAPGADDMERQLDRLEVRHGDILVLRTTQKLQSATAKKWQDDLIRMCAAAG